MGRLKTIVDAPGICLREWSMACSGLSAQEGSWNSQLPEALGTCPKRLQEATPLTPSSDLSTCVEEKGGNGRGGGNSEGSWGGGGLLNAFSKSMPQSCCLPESRPAGRQANHPQRAHQARVKVIEHDALIHIPRKVLLRHLPPTNIPST